LPALLIIVVFLIGTNISNIYYFEKSLQSGLKSIVLYKTENNSLWRITSDKGKAAHSYDFALKNFSNKAVELKIKYTCQVSYNGENFNYETIIEDADGNDKTFYIPPKQTIDCIGTFTINNPLDTDISYSLSYNDGINIVLFNDKEQYKIKPIGNQTY